MIGVIRKLSIYLVIMCLCCNNVGATNKQYCQNVLDWIYRDMAMENMKLSYERALYKMLLGMQVASKNLNKANHNPTLFTRITNLLRGINHKYESEIKPQQRSLIESWSDVSRGSEHGDQSIKDLMLQWRKLQKDSPKLFKGLDREFYLDEWDEFSAEILDNLKNIPVKDQKLQNKLKYLQEQAAQSTRGILAPPNHYEPEQLENEIDSTQRKLMETLKENVLGNLDEYQDYCSEDELALLLKENNYVCPFVDNASGPLDLSEKLANIKAVLAKGDLLKKERPEELIPVEEFKYKTSSEPNSTFCYRDMELVKYIVIHHTATSSKMSPEQLNGMHLNNTSHGEPWYMIGYNYLVSSSYDGASAKAPKIIRGRAENVQGAHAGGWYKDLNTVYDWRFYQKRNVRCGNPQVGFKTKHALSQTNENFEVNANLISMGIAVVGNYSESYQEEVDGIQIPKNIMPDKKDVLTPGKVDAIARLACDIQSRQPKIRTIVPHSFFVRTECPAEIKNFLGQIAQKAQDYGCNFEVKYEQKEKK